MDLRITSSLPFAQIPVDPWIDFASLATEAGVKGVLDPNSIQVLDAVSDNPVPHALSRHFHHGQQGRVQWVVAGSGAERLSDPLSDGSRPPAAGSSSKRPHDRHR